MMMMMMMGRKRGRGMNCVEDGIGFSNDNDGIDAPRTAVTLKWG